MDRDELLALLTPEAMTLLDEFAGLDTAKDVVGAVTALRRAGADARTSAAVLEQLRLRRRARAKLGSFAERMLFTADGLAQATRLDVAARHAQRFRDAGVRRIADLGCGIGADAMAFAALGFEVVAVERDEVTAAIAAHNLAVFPNATVVHASAEEFDLDGFDGVWLDPARRTAREGATERGASRRLADPADWSPSLDFAFGLAPERAVGVKLGPAIDHELLPGHGEAQWVAVQGELVEYGVWLGAAARPGVRRSALVIGPAGPDGRGRADELTATTPVAEAKDAAVGPLGGWLHEPSPAVIRGRFIGRLAQQLDGRMIAPGIAWITTDGPAPTPFAQSFEVLEVLKLDAGALKKELRSRGIGALEIKVRGVDLDPAEFRKRLALRGDESTTLICTRLADGGGERRVAILARRAQRTPAAADRA